MAKPHKDHAEPFDFDDWATLASNNPEGFEQRRQDVIENYLRGLPTEKQRRLRGWQFRIDMERRRAGTPMGACIKLSSMMWDSFLGPSGLAATLKSAANPRAIGKTSTPRPSARVISFTKN